MTDTNTNPADAYAVVRDELISGLAQVDDTTSATLVPACPDWTAKDVVAHLSGLNAELLAEVAGRLGSDEATTRQVDDRAAAHLGEVIGEWQSLAPAIGERMAANESMATALLADLVIHVYDLEEVLEQPTVAAADATPRSAHRYVPLLQERLAEQMDIALAIELTDGTEWPATAGSAPVALRTDPHSFLRGVTGRLTRSEVEAFDWSIDPTDILDTAWNQYGPFRT